MLLGIVEGIGYLQNPSIYVYQLNWSSFLPLLGIAILILPLQTSVEELLMRGYLMQGISLIFSQPWIPLLVTSLIFGFLHYANPEVAKYGFWVTMPSYIGIGLALAIMTLMDDGLELALGVHAANNIFGALFITFDGSALSTPAIFKVTVINPLAGTIFTIVVSIIFIIIVSRVYRWADWSKIYQSNPPHDEQRNELS
ncbi:MAG: CPBP family intramembrane metalloprotease [Saprospiraceae bacterium]|nr:CPBP family intramembrane metalloprotease [Saprospiraceae bacterium]